MVMIPIAPPLGDILREMEKRIKLLEKGLAELEFKVNKPKHGIGKYIDEVKARV